MKDKKARMQYDFLVFSIETHYCFVDAEDIPLSSLTCRLKSKIGHTNYVNFNMSLIPRPLSGEALEDERRREAEKRERFRDTVKDLTTPFYQGIDTSNEIVRLVSTLKQDEQNFIWRFKVRIYSRVNEHMMVPLYWGVPGQVEVTYSADGREIRKQTISLELNERNQTGTEAILTDNIGYLLEWENFLLIYLVFIPRTTTFFQSRDSPAGISLRQLSKRHYEIYASPSASIWREFSDWGQAPGDQESTSSSEAAESPESSVDSLAVSSAENTEGTVSQNSDALLNTLWRDTFISWEKIEFHCNMKWDDDGPLKYTIDFQTLHGNLFFDDGNGRVMPQRLPLAYIQEEEIPALLEYYTEHGRLMNGEHILIQVSNSGTIELRRELGDTWMWDDFIIISLRFEPLKIDYRYFSNIHGEGRATIQTAQRICWRFEVGSANIRGKMAENELDPRFVERPLPDVRTSN